MNDVNPYARRSEPLSPEAEKLAAILVHIAGIFLEFFAPLAGLPFPKGPRALHQAPRY